MRRYFTAFLLAYSIVMTVTAGWLGARALVYWQILTVGLGMKANRPSHQQVLANFGAPWTLTDLASQSAMMVAGLEPINLVAFTFLTFLACLGFASRRRASLPQPEQKKD